MNQFLNDNQFSSSLRDLVSDQLDRHWIVWAEQHPHLAKAIDRTRLIESAVEQLRDDPEFSKAMRQAHLDEHRLAEAARILSLAERWVGQILPSLRR